MTTTSVLKFKFLCLFGFFVKFIYLCLNNTVIFSAPETSTIYFGHDQGNTNRVLFFLLLNSELDSIWNYAFELWLATWKENTTTQYNLFVSTHILITIFRSFDATYTLNEF